jgi:hypothetical protein
MKKILLSIFISMFVFVPLMQAQILEDFEGGTSDLTMALLPILPQMVSIVRHLLVLIPKVVHTAIPCLVYQICHLR